MRISLGVQVIARAGIASRRRAEDLITAGNVKVNGSVVTVPQHPVLLSGADKVQWLTVLFRMATAILTALLTVEPCLCC